MSFCNQKFNALLKVGFVLILRPNALHIAHFCYCQFICVCPGIKIAQPRIKSNISLKQTVNRTIQGQNVGRPLHQLLQQSIAAIRAIGDNQCRLLVVAYNVV